MKKAISLFLAFSILALSGGLFANEKMQKFSLIRNNKNAVSSKVKSEFSTLKMDFLLSYEQTLLITPPQHKKVNLHFSKKEDFWQGVRIGALIGGAVMLAVVLFSDEESVEFIDSSKPGTWFNDWSVNFWLSKLLTIGAGAVLGGLIGGAIATKY